MAFPSDLEIARGAALKPLEDVADAMGIASHLLEPHGEEVMKIKLDKDDFLGKPELAWQHEQNGTSGARLVGLQPDNGSLVPAEASQIVDGQRIVGRVTSSRMSPTLGRSICLAQVEAVLAAPGTRVTVRLPGGRLIGARVTEHLAHVDPEGSRMRV